MLQPVYLQLRKYPRALGHYAWCQIRTFIAGNVVTAKSAVGLRIERLKQRLCFLKIARLETFGEPTVDRREEIAGLISLP